MHVYRVENTQGLGPYNSWDTSGWGDDIEFVPERHPRPLEDSLLAKPWSELSQLRKEKFSFGFLNSRQLTSWFPKRYLERLAEANYSLNKYQVDSLFVIKGDKQCVFMPTKATLVSRCRPDAIELEHYRGMVGA
jgi:hypothetical protein